MRIDRHTYQICWSEEDDMYIGTVAEYPSLSWLAVDPVEALRGIRTLVADVAQDIEAVTSTMAPAD